jgi:Ca2+-binding EF-hand superfamily protein
MAGQRNSGYRKLPERKSGRDSSCIRIQERRKSMRKRLAMLGTFSIGMAAFATNSGFANDDKKVGIRPVQNIQDAPNSAKLLIFKLADTNNDGQISQKEAIDAGNLLVGGFFFRADANGDGTLSPEETGQIRDNLFAQHPLLKIVLERAKSPDAKPTSAPASGQPSNDRATTGKRWAANPAETLGNLLDTNHDRNIQASEVRQAVQSGVQAIYGVADTNQDGQLTPHELNAAVVEAAKSAVQTVFQAADTDRNGSLSTSEYDKALAEPAHALFRVIDADNNGQLTLAEIEQAEQILADQIARLRGPEHPNSVSHQTSPGASTSRLQTPGLAAPGAQTTDNVAAPR